MIEAMAKAPAFQAYAIACIVLSLNLIGLWVCSGVLRGKSRTAINAEDAPLFSANFADVDPPEVARALRAHRNAMATSVPFLVLGLVFVLAGGAYVFLVAVCVVFCAARIIHSFAYVAHRQPWRTIAFTVGELATVALIVALAWKLFSTGG
jgi:prostaglandin-E synthase 1